MCSISAECRSMETVETVERADRQVSGGVLIPGSSYGVWALIVLLYANS